MSLWVKSFRLRACRAPQSGDLGDGPAEALGVSASVVLLGEGDLTGLALLQAEEPPLLAGSEARGHEAGCSLVRAEGGAGDTEVDADAREPVRYCRWEIGDDAEGHIHPCASLERVALRTTPPRARLRRKRTQPSFGRRTSAHFRESLRTWMAWPGKGMDKGARRL